MKEEVVFLSSLIVEDFERIVLESDSREAKIDELLSITINILYLGMYKPKVFKQLNKVFVSSTDVPLLLSQDIGPIINEVDYKWIS